MALRTGATSSSGRGGCHERKGRGRGGGATSPRRAPTLSSIPAVRFPHRARLPPPASQPRAPPTAGRLQARSRPPPAASQPRLPTPSSTPAGRLPRRGLSNFYAGKSKSFTSLAEAAAKAAAKEIAKPENPFNKRRRVLAAWSRRRASCSSLVTTYLPPLLSLDHTVVEGDEGEEDEDRSNDGGDEDDDASGKGRREKAAAASSPRRFPPPKLHSVSQKGSSMARGLNPITSSFRSPRSFSLSDLQNAG